MATFKPQYGAKTALSTLSAMATNTYHQSAYVDNTINQSDEEFITVTFTPASAPTAGGCFYVYAECSVDATNWPDGITGVDGSFSVTSVNYRLIGVVNPNGASTMTSQPMALSTVFGGTIPPQWVIVIQNALGVNLSGTVNHTPVQYIYS